MRFITAGLYHFRAKAKARDFEFPTGVNAIISTYALSLVPESSQWLEKAVRAILDLRFTIDFAPAGVQCFPKSLS